MAQLLAPDADIETAGWASTPLFSKVNKAYPGTAVGLIQSSVDPVNVDFEVSLATGIDPNTDKGHRFKCGIRNNVAGSTDWTVEVKQGAAVIATGTFTGVTTTAPTVKWFSFKITEAEAANITDYSALSVRVSVNKVSGTSIRGQVDSMFLEIPDVGSCTTPIPGGIPAANIRSWLHYPAMGYANNDPIITAQDESGNGNSSVVGSGSPTFKTDLVNGLSGVEFDGVDDQLRMFFDEAAERITYFHILRHLTVPAQINDDYVITTSEFGNTVKVMLGLTWATASIPFTGPHYLIEQEGASNHQYMGDNLPQTSTFVVLRTRFDAGPTGDRFWSDGVEITDGTMPGDAGSNPTIGVKDGSREDETFWWHGQMISRMICQGLTDQQEEAVQADMIALLAAGGGGGGAVVPDGNRMGGTGAIRRPRRWLSLR